MGIFNVQICGSSSEPLVVDIPDGVIGEIWYFTDDGTNNYCGQIISESSDEGATYTGVSSYNNCYDCLNGIGVASLEFNPCGTSDQIFITPSDFGYLPSIGDVFYMTYQFSGEETINTNCVSFINVDYGNEPRDFIISQESYDGCEQCLFLNTPRSGNTAYEECIICCPCDTGATVNSVSAPHPEWTDGYGTQVTQLNMVVLGGPNGLNA